MKAKISSSIVLIALGLTCGTLFADQERTYIKIYSNKTYSGNHAHNHLFHSRHRYKSDHQARIDYQRNHHISSQINHRAVIGYPLIYLNGGRFTNSFGSSYEFRYNHNRSNHNRHERRYDKRGDKRGDKRKDWRDRRRDRSGN